MAVINSIAGQDQCKMSKKTGKCRGLFRRYYYDSSDGKCKKFTYGGCQANGNNFRSKRACERTCGDGGGAGGGRRRGAKQLLKLFKFLLPLALLVLL